MKIFHYLVDGHCDTLTALEKQKRTLGEKSSRGQLDLVRLLAGGVNVQFFAAFIAPRYKDTALKRCLSLIDTFYSELQVNQDRMEVVLNRGDIQRITGLNKVAAILAVEGGEALSGDLAMLRILYRLGVRSLTLTWNGRNEIGDGVGEGETGGGLSCFGQSVVRELNNLGMLIDVSHLHERGFWHVAAISKQPFAATHANSRAVCNHIRNLTDSQIGYLAKTGGVLGLTFVPDFIAARDASMEKLIRHIDHLAARFGVGCIGLGSDFDGMDECARGLEDVTCMPRLGEELAKRGYSDTDIASIMGGNWVRLLNQVLK